MDQMDSPKGFERLVRKIVEEFEPERILIFGSYASGQAGPDSDLDIVIIKESGDRPMLRRRKVLELLKGSGIPKDIFVLTPGEFEEDKDEAGTVAYEANHFGKVVYG